MSQARPHTPSEAGPIPYVRYGIPAGITGAAIVALFFLAVDAAAERPLATPSALGASLFLGEPLDLAHEPRATLVLGYTFVHGAVFIAMGCLGALAVTSIPRLPSPAALAAWLTAALFVFCEAVFLGFGLVFGSPLGSELGFGRIALANLLAAGGMALLLARLASGAGSTGETAAGPARAARRRRDERAPIDPRELQSPPSGRVGPGAERS